MDSRKVVIYGSKGALGSAIVNYFKSKNWYVIGIDMVENEVVDFNIIVNKDADWVGQEAHVLQKVSEALKGEKVDAVICVAGGWAGGNSKTDLAKNSDMMWKQSVWTSTISAAVAANHMKEGGFLSLTGAKAALEGTAGMIGYGMAKSAIHQLTKSLSAADSGLPKNSLVISILPVTLDTPMNRKWMADADFSTWTPLDFIAETFFKWTTGENRPENGSLLQLITTGGVTQIIKA